MMLTVLDLSQTLRSDQFPGVEFELKQNFGLDLFHFGELFADNQDMRILFNQKTRGYGFVWKILQLYTVPVFA